MTEIVLDDDDLLRDRLLRTLHKNRDGHLCANEKGHEQAIQVHHNAGTLFVYSRESDGAYTLHEHYIYSEYPLDYKQWKTQVIAEAERVVDNNELVVGVYGWLTTAIPITPLRTGDLFIKIDKTGAHGVRISFDSAKVRRKARNEKTAKRNTGHRNRV